MRQTARSVPGQGLFADLAVIRRYFWLPIAAITIAVVAVLAIGQLRTTSGDARFRANVIVDALPPLFGPAVTPSPFDYARLATSDIVLQDVASRTNTPIEQLRPRMSADARLGTAEIDFNVSGSNALAIARAWNDAFAAAAADQTPVIQRLLVEPYARQLDEARAALADRAAAAKAAPDDAVVEQQLVAAQENFETASKLTQSYDVVAKTITAQSFAVVAPHEPAAAVRSTLGRVAAAIAFGLLAGVAGVLVLGWASRRRIAALPAAEAAPAAFRRRGERRTS